MNDNQYNRSQIDNDTDSIECGIDLGTTNSLCAWVNHVDPRSKPPFSFQFAYHRQNDRITPSVVSVDSESGEILVGLDATENELANPRDTVRSIKRLMGRRFSEKEVGILRKIASYRIDQDEAGMAVVVLGGKPYKPTEISAMILRRIKADAEAHFRKNITHVVIAVPAYFDDSQIHATREAARQAGFVVKRVVSEPVAASYAYGYGLTPGQNAKVLVVDIGGGTTDVTIIRAAQPPPCLEMAHAGDMWLGGDDVDSRLVKAKTTEIEKQFQVDPTVDPAFIAQLVREVRRAKEVLCQGSKKNEGLKLERRIEVTGGNGVSAVKVMGISVSQQEVAEAVGAVAVDKTLELVKEALKKAHLPASRIDHVILVGGGAYLLGIDKALRQIFSPTQISEIQDPIAAVALGCGILAKLIAGVQCSNKHDNDGNAARCSVPGCGELLDPVESITALPYGIRVMGGGFEVVLKRGTRVGIQAPEARTFYTARPDQVRISVPVYEGEEPVADENRLQGFITVQFPTPKPLNTPVEMRMSVDRNRLLEIRVACEGFQVRTHLKPGDWSTSLQKEIEQIRRVNPKSDAVIEGDNLLNDWSTAPRDSEKEREVEDLGRKLLLRLREREWEWLVRVPLEFLLKLSGDGGKLRYLDILGRSVSEQVDATLKRYRDFKASGRESNRDTVERAIWDAIRAVFRDTDGKCLFLIHFFGAEPSSNPDHKMLARDLIELDAILGQHHVAKQGNPAAREHLDRARSFLTAVTNRDYYKRVNERWGQRDDGGDLSPEPIHAQGMDTKAMRNQN